MPHTPPLSVSDYTPAGILCPGGQFENSAKPHWCWISDYSPFGMLKPHRHWNLPDEDNTYTSYYFDKPLDLDFDSETGDWTKIGYSDIVFNYSMTIEFNSNGDGAYIEFNTDIDSTYSIYIEFVEFLGLGPAYQISARDDQGNIIEYETITAQTSSPVNFDFQAEGTTSRIYIVRINERGSTYFTVKNLSVTGKYPKKEELYLSYRYGFNNMEKDDELKGTGNSYDFGARMYDPRIGRWLAVDPLSGKYPGYSPYCFVANMPIIAIDPDGKDIIVLFGATAGENNNYNDQAGHVVIVVTRYKEVKVKDSEGNIQTFFQQDGYYILENHPWQSKHRTATDNDLNKLLLVDGSVIIKKGTHNMETLYSHDEIAEELKLFQKAKSTNKKFNLANYHCTDFAIELLNEIGIGTNNPNFGKSEFQLYDHEKDDYEPVKFAFPNKLFKDLKDAGYEIKYENNSINNIENAEDYINRHPY